MTQPLRALIVEDSEDDALLIVRELRKGGFDPTFERVESPKAMKEALRGQTWDIVLADYSMPLFNGLDALRILQESGQDLPFIIVSGSIGEETAVTAMKAGAHDYVMKDNLPRLLPAISRELHEVEVRRERKRAEERLKESERQLRYLSSELLTAQEKERKRIAGELHDSVAASLGAIKFSIEKMFGQMEQDERARIASRDLVSRVQQIIEDTRRIMSDLRPAVLDDLGIVPAITWFCREFQKTYSGISIEKQMDIKENGVPDSLRTPIFRIFQEALNNVAKHSKATSVNLSLQKSADGIELTIRDNGQGLTREAKGPAEGSRNGLGLVSMRERAELSGGSFSITSVKGAGTHIRVFWPHRKE